MMPLDLSIALLLTATFLAAWQTIQWHVATRGPISQARTITKLNSRFYSSASLAFIILLLFPQFEGQARSIFHFSKFYEYIDVFGVCAAGINIDLHFGFHHLTTPYLTLVRVLWYSEGWKVVAGLNAFHHFLMHMVVEYDSDKEAAADVDTGDDVIETTNMRQVLIATSASARNRLVGMGGVVRNIGSGGADDVVAKYSVTLGPKDEQNAYTAELGAIAVVLKCIPDGLYHQEVIIITGNRSTLQAIAKSRQQSGQSTTREIYKHARRLDKGGNGIKMHWVSSTNESFILGAEAKAESRQPQTADTEQRNRRTRPDRPD
ncbi:hypothetical protein LZL87_014178 [Fusarium oxysporum]|nr:hypothetical protein LZL87_014178 [Fusarium oxysporum]